MWGVDRKDEDEDQLQNKRGGEGRWQTRMLSSIDRSCALRLSKFTQNCALPQKMAPCCCFSPLTKELRAIIISKGCSCRIIANHHYIRGPQPKSGWVLISQRQKRRSVPPRLFIYFCPLSKNTPRLLSLRLEKKNSVGSAAASYYPLALWHLSKAVSDRCISEARFISQSMCHGVVM